VVVSLSLADELLSDVAVSLLFSLVILSIESVLLEVTGDADSSVSALVPARVIWELVAVSMLDVLSITLAVRLMLVSVTLLLNEVFVDFDVSVVVLFITVALMLVSLFLALQPVVIDVTSELPLDDDSVLPAIYLYTGKADTNGNLTIY